LQTRIPERTHIGFRPRKIYDHENALAVHLKLKPSERLRRHITPVDVLFYVLEGEGVVEIGDEKITVTKDTAIHSSSKIVHCWYNESDKPLRVLARAQFLEHTLRYLLTVLAEAWLG
jgi:quercetin dioxygenase-like cupin family protein